MDDQSNKSVNVDRQVRGRRGWRRLLTWSVVLVVVLVPTAVLTFYVGLWKTRVAIEARQHSAAESWLGIAVLGWPKNAEWYYLSAIVNRRFQRFDAVEKNLRKAHELGWNVAELEREQTLAHAQTGQFQKVGNRWSDLFMAAGSDGPEICRAFVNFSLARFRLDEAALVIESWKADFPDDPGPYVVEGTVTSVLLRWAEAETLFRTALQIDPRQDEARGKLATSLMKQQKFPEAEEQLRTVLKGAAAVPDLRASLAHCVAQQGRLDEALDILQTGLEQDADNLRLLAENGRLYLMLGDNEAALKALSAVLEKEPENTELRYSLAQALRNLGREQDAQEHFRLVDQGTKALLQLSRMTSAVVDNPSDVEARFKVASVTWHWKSRADGLSWLRSVLEFDPDHKATHALLAQHYEEAGDLMTAEIHRKKSQGE